METYIILFILPSILPLAEPTPHLKKIKVIPEIVLDEGNNKVEATRPNYIYKIPFKDKAPEGSLIMRF